MIGSDSGARTSTARMRETVGWAREVTTLIVGRAIIGESAFV